MFRRTFGKGKYEVRFDGTETKVDVRGSLTRAELRMLLRDLIFAECLRHDHDRSGGRRGRYRLSFLDKLCSRLR